MGIQVITGVSTAALAEALADRFAAPTDDPFAAEMIVVPTRGIERYLTQTIADRAGISANIDFPSPRELLERITGHDDPWRPDRLVWPLLATIDAALAEPWAEPLAAHLRDDPERRRSDRRYALARRLAGLFDRYAMERPQLLRDWDVGDPTGIPDDLQWQYPLWRAVRDRIGSAPWEPPRDPGDLPDRIAVFGPTRLPERFCEALRALSEQREVELYLPVASPALWGSSKWPAAAAARMDDSTRSLAQHPLLQSLGRDARELRQRLGTAGTSVSDPEFAAPPTLLGQLQAEIAANRDSTIAARRSDDSIQIHACHGSLRQVEVLREVVLSLLQNDPSLQPRDILIMTPDLDTYAPLLAAVFGDPDPQIRDLRLAIADRAPEQHNQVLLALDALLTLLNGRMRRSDVLDLLKLEPVRARFGLTADDVLRIEELAESANVRWGLEDADREDHRSGGHDLGTWSWGLDRMALGAALSDDPLTTVGEALPLPDIGSGDIDPTGRFAVFLDRLSQLRARAQQRRSLAEWNALLQEAIEGFTQVRRADAWQDARARGALAAFPALAGSFASTVDLSLTDIRHLIASVLAGRPTRAGFRLGGATACRMEPMRSVPYRVIALLGMDDGAFPRKADRDGDDLLLRGPLIGERDPRSEDRQLLLDAIMASGQHLIITYAGRDERTNDERHPAVPIAELLDLLPADLVQQHPLQPFDPANFALPSPFSHDTAALAGALVAQKPRAPKPFLAAPLPAPDPMPEWTTASLAKLLRMPTATFFEQRLRVHAPRQEEEADELVPVALSPLTRYQVGETLLQARLQDGDLAGITDAVRRGGLLPPAALGDLELQTIAPAAETIVARTLAVIGGLDPETVEADLDLGAGRRLQIRVADVYAGRIVRSTFAKAKPKQALSVWPDLLALAAAYPARPWSARVEANEGYVDLQAPPAAEARAALQDLFVVAESALRSPLAITADTGLAYAKARAHGKTVAMEAAAAAWGRDRERAGFAVMRTLGAAAPFRALLQGVPLAGEQVSGEDTRFGCLALRLYGPLAWSNPDAGLQQWPKGAPR